MQLPTANTIKADLGLNNGGKVHEYFTKTCRDEMIPFIPKGDTLLLSQNGKVTAYDEISYDSPYANYMYNGILYVDPVNGKGAYYSPDYGFWSRPGIAKVPSGKTLNYHTPGTGAFWDERMWNSRKDKVIEQVQQFMDRSN